MYDTKIIYLMVDLWESEKSFGRVWIRIMFVKNVCEQGKLV